MKCQRKNRDVDEIVQLAGPDLQNSQTKGKLINLIRTNRDVFVLPKDPLGTTVGSEQYIGTINNPPFENASYNICSIKFACVSRKNQGNVR